MHGEGRGAYTGEPTRGGVAAEIVWEPLRTVLLNDTHRCHDFVCSKSERVTKFFSNERHELVPQNYCRVFILPNPHDATHIWGFYTLAPGALVRSRATGSDQKRIPGGLPIPMVLIGFMGKQDGAPKGLGEALLTDAARRVHRCTDIPAWGLMLDSENGPDNAKLWGWYKEQGFTPAKPDDKERLGVMYASLKKFDLGA
jgi:hypothetical protein